ncbi:MAG TPA: heavy metal translocating P-type ATPase [Methanocorpusculum sp.]|nr:heavy metal translocating P-type ATPase [Methanocorpusculum sp.]
MKQTFTVYGMSCQVCAQNVERAAGKVSGVTSASVNLLTNTLVVESENVPEEIIVDAVKNAGYRAVSGRAVHVPDHVLMRRRLILSICFFIPLLVVSLLSLAGIFFTAIPLVVACIECVLALILVWVNRKFFVQGIPALVRGHPNMDSLVSLGATAAVVYSIVVLILMTADSSLTYPLYFTSAGMILTLVTVGKYLESRSKEQTTASISRLLDLSPKTATLVNDDTEVIVPVAEVRPGDIVLVKSGSLIPVDGTVVSGSSSIDVSALTGESLPVAKKAGDSVQAGTLCLYGSIRLVAEKTGGDTTLAQIIDLVQEASSSKAPISRLADTISGIFVPLVMAIAVIVFAIWMIAGASVSAALSFGIAVLVISCPCALGLATPVAIMVGTGKAASLGILIKSAAALESAGRADTVVFDKTGTLTAGTPAVTGISCSGSDSESAFLSLAVSLESPSSHPYAQAVVRYASAYRPEHTENFTTIPGRGVSAEIGHELCRAGNRKFMEESGIVIPPADPVDGSRIYVSRGSVLLGSFTISDTVRPSSAAAVSRIRRLGLHTVMLTGDSERTAAQVAESTGIGTYHAELLPADKKAELEKMHRNGQRMIMVGDGINDAPSLAYADVGIAIGAGSDIAMESADIVLIGSDPESVADTVSLSRATIRIIRQNLFWAFIYNVIAIPVAAGALFLPFGIHLSPGIAALCMSCSSVCVVLNSLRLRRFRGTVSATDSIDTVPQQTTTSMQKVISIEGMMCKHCQAAVMNALKGIDGVTDVVVSLEEKSATVTVSSAVSDETLKNAIVAADFEVVGISTR